MEDDKSIIQRGSSENTRPTLFYFDPTLHLFMKEKRLQLLCAVIMYLDNVVKTVSRFRRTCQTIMSIYYF